MSDYALKFSISNGRIRRALESAGFTSVNKFCEANPGLRSSEVGKLLNFKNRPMTKDGQWSKCAVRIAEALNVLPEDLFSEAQRGIRVKSNSAIKFITEKQAIAAFGRDMPRSIADNEGVSEYEQEQKSALINKLLETELTPRESKVLKLRFHEELSLEDTAIKFDVTRERIRQIEAKALRKLRTSRSEKLRELCDFIPDEENQYEETGEHSETPVAPREPPPSAPREPPPSAPRALPESALPFSYSYISADTIPYIKSRGYVDLTTLQGAQKAYLEESFADLPGTLGAYNSVWFYRMANRYAEWARASTLDFRTEYIAKMKMFHEMARALISGRRSSKF